MIPSFNKKRNKEFLKDKILFQIIIIIFLIFIVLLLSADFRIYKKRQELNNKINNYKKEIEEIKNNNEKLKNKIANSDNIDYLEKIAYEQLGEARPGETVYSFVYQKEDQKNEEKKEDLNFFENLWNWFKNKF